MTSQTTQAGIAGRFLELLGAKGVVQGPDMERYLVDWRGISRGKALLVARPDTTEQVSRVVGLCNELQLPIYVQGGNTSLCQGAIPGSSETAILLSTERMDKILEIDAVGNAVAVQSGVVLSRLHEAVARVQRKFPLSLGAEGTAQIGGLIATNAGGIAALRYGSMRQMVLGLEVVLPDGSVVRRMAALHKDNRGLDWKQLFVGSEGTLGIITEASLKLHPQTHTGLTALLAVPTVEAAVACFQRLQARFDTHLSACEIINQAEVELALAHISDTQFPFPEVPPYCVLFDLADADAARDFSQDAETCLMELIEAECACDAVICKNGREADALWHLRHALPEANKLGGLAVMFDVSARLSRLAAFTEAAEKAANADAPSGRAVFMGHLGDGNLHWNWMLPKGTDSLEAAPLIARIRAAVNDVLAAQGGSFSAEHGIGRKHVGDLDLSLPPEEIKLMRSLKQALDPDNLFSPGVMFAGPPSIDA